ncbi:MAG: radical SAM protein [Coriobacteriia bacterium]|nr:radical SAM protein [Coriobacteriia bacterium]
MSKYIINKNIALRSWKIIPYAYYEQGIQLPHLLGEDEFKVMLSCDGNTSFDKNSNDEQILNKLIKQGLVHEVKGDEQLNNWQKYRNCNNRIVPYITLEITQKCNFNCLHCFNAADMKVPRHELSFEQICNILDQALECGIQNVLITGGEPMLHPRFMDIMHAIYDRGLIVYELNTNGYFLTREILQEMKDSNMKPKMKVSFDGLGFHDKIRNSKGCEQRTLDAIALCKEYGFDTRAQMQMNKLNVESILPTLIELDKMGVDETRVTRTTESPRWNMTYPDGSIKWSEFYQKALDIVAEYCKNDVSMLVEFWLYFCVNPKSKTFWCEHVRYNEESFNTARPLCKCNRANISIGANGNVYPCLQMSGAFDALDIKLGNILETPLQELLNDSLYSKLAQSCIKDRIERNNRCKQCPFLKYCGGGCTLMGMIFNGDYFGADNSACVFFRDGWHEKIASKFKDWNNLDPIPDDIDPSYLVNLGIDEVPHIDMDALRNSKFEI